MDIKLTINPPLVAAVVLGEIFSFVWYSLLRNRGHPGEYGDRYLITALVTDVGLAVLLQNIVRDYWRVGGWEDAAVMSLWLTLLYACLEAPHVVHGSRSFSRFFVHTLHKMALIFVMTLALHYFKSYRY